MVIDLKKLNTKARVLIVAAIGAAGSMNVPQVKDFILPIVTAHPRWSSAATSLIFVIGVIQNPTTQKILHQLGLDEDSTKAETTPTQS